jgi:hypothetical protein
MRRSSSRASDGPVRIRLAALLLATSVFATTPLPDVAAEPDHELARRAREAGEIAPLSKILAALESTFSGEVVEVELERDDGRWTYEIELLTPAGSVIELTYDARTAELLETEGRGVDAARKQP